MHVIEVMEMVVRFRTVVLCVTLAPEPLVTRYLTPHRKPRCREKALVTYVVDREGDRWLGFMDDSGDWRKFDWW